MGPPSYIRYRSKWGLSFTFAVLGLLTTACLPKNQSDNSVKAHVRNGDQEACAAAIEKVRQSLGNPGNPSGSGNHKSNVQSYVDRVLAPKLEGEWSTPDFNYEEVFDKCFVTRENWLTKSSGSTVSGRKSLGGVKQIILHHTVSSQTADINGHRDYHINDKGWADIGYHYLIGKNQDQYWIYEGMPKSGSRGDQGASIKSNKKSEYLLGVHAAGANTGSVGISLNGNFYLNEQYPDTDAVILVGALIRKIHDETLSTNGNKIDVVMHGNGSLKSSDYAEKYGPEHTRTSDGNRDCPGETFVPIARWFRDYAHSAQIDAVATDTSDGGGTPVVTTTPAQKTTVSTLLDSIKANLDATDPNAEIHTTSEMYASTEALENIRLEGSETNSIQFYRWPGIDQFDQGNTLSLDINSSAFFDIKAYYYWADTQSTGARPIAKEFVLIASPSKVNNASNTQPKGWIDIDVLKTRIPAIDDQKFSNAIRQIRLVSNEDQQGPLVGSSSGGSVPITRSFEAEIAHAKARVASQHRQNQSVKDSFDKISSCLAPANITYRSSARTINTGQLIVHKGILKIVEQAFEEVSQDEDFYIQSVTDMSAFNWSDNDSMSANNTSSWNFRPKTGSTTQFSFHSSGLAIDINPYDNPYTKSDGTRLPELSSGIPVDPRRHIDSASRVRTIFESYGFKWGIAFNDRMHFEFLPCRNGSQIQSSDNGIDISDRPSCQLDISCRQDLSAQVRALLTVE